MERTWKPVVAGTLDMVGAFLGIWIAWIATSLSYQQLSEGKDYYPAFFFIFCVILPLMGGFCSFTRRIWPLALIGSFSLIYLFPLAIPAIILVARSKKEFR